MREETRTVKVYVVELTAQQRSDLRIYLGTPSPIIALPDSLEALLLDLGGRPVMPAGGSFVSAADDKDEEDFNTLLAASRT